MLETADLGSALRRYWGYDSFRPLQERIVNSLLEGHDVAVVMPTGGGKSLCYQLPAVISGRTAIVVSPLISLMQDQAAQLAQMGIPAGVINSSVQGSDQSKVMREAIGGGFRLLYLSPERLAREETLAWLGRVPLAFFAIDEAHCISEWGHEFRPEYRQLRRLREYFPDVPIAAFTASATQRVRHDILNQLGLREPHKYIASFHRPNLRYIIQECDAKSQEKLLIRGIRAYAGANIIVYAPTVARVEETVDFLEGHRIAAVPYHGQMDNLVRQRNQERWMSDETRILVGTIAFGLGINKSSVRAVIHLSLPKSIEQYYQEAGRAGRDGAPSDCVMLWRKKDIGLLAYFIDQLRDPGEKQRAWEQYHAVKSFAAVKVCRHRRICSHFGETPKWTNCGMCDVCAALPDWFNDPKKPTTAAKLDAPRRATEQTDAADAGLLEFLRAWRRETAREKQVPAFLILSDASLHDICRKRPQSLGELTAGISGIGTRKAELYGAQILEALRRYSGGERSPDPEPSRTATPAEETIHLLKEGNSFEDIARLRGRRVETVVGMVATLVEQGKIAFQANWVRPDLLPGIEQAVRELGPQWLKPLKERVPEATYEEIRLVVASARAVDKGPG